MAAVEAAVGIGVVPADCGQSGEVRAGICTGSAIEALRRGCALVVYCVPVTPRVRHFTGRDRRRLRMHPNKMRTAGIEVPVSLCGSQCWENYHHLHEDAPGSVRLEIRFLILRFKPGGGPAPALGRKSVASPRPAGAVTG
jgi:hypothetical protein